MSLRVLLVITLLLCSAISAQRADIASASIQAQAKVVPAMGMQHNPDSLTHTDLLVWGRRSSSLQVVISSEETMAGGMPTPVQLAGLFVPYATLSDPRVHQEIQKTFADGAGSVVITVVDIAD